jgi:hypothetical protein
MTEQDRREYRATTQRERRHIEAARRRDANRDVMLYRGPAEWGDLDRDRFRQVRNRYRRNVASLVLAQNVTLRDHTIPAGSKLVIDMRNGMPDVPCVELIRTCDGSIRLHAWTIKGELDRSRDIPIFRLAGMPTESDQTILYDIQENMEINS